VLDGVPVVDGSISGPPPSAAPGARVYLSGAQAATVAGLPWAGAVVPVVLGGEVGAASALKMCTAGVYKGLNALVIQAMRTAGRYGVLDDVLADLARNGLDGSAGVARSATKAHRFVDEMREIAATQAGVGLTPTLFAALAEVYAEIARTALADGDPEDAADLPAAEVVARLSASSGR
jgi:3-hydroxyisobutyrate dehydrogenase-like beta-hydroxyacid dehydrogenase